MKFDGCVASSEASVERLKGHGIPVYDLNSVSSLRFYIDGADETNEHPAPDQRWGRSTDP